MQKVHYTCIPKVASLKKILFSLTCVASEYGVLVSPVMVMEGRTREEAILGDCLLTLFFPKFIGRENHLRREKKIFLHSPHFFSLCLAVWMSVKYFFPRKKNISRRWRMEGKTASVLPPKVSLFLLFSSQKKGKNIASSGNRKDFVKFVFLVKRVLSFERRDDD